jgi:hypothetical protein
MADQASTAGPSGLYNMRMGPISMPAAPQFVINVRRNQNNGVGGASGMNIQISSDENNAPNNGGDVPTEEE